MDADDRRPASMAFLCPAPRLSPNLLWTDKEQSLSTDMLSHAKNGLSAVLRNFRKAIVNMRQKRRNMRYIDPYYFVNNLDAFL
jgi:hypothetical protein